MTREEAIKRLKEYAQYSYGIWHDDEEDTKAFDMAIEALYHHTEKADNISTKVKSDLIIKGAKGIKDGLYNITDGKLFEYKVNGGTVRVYSIVPSAEAEWIPCSESLPSDDGEYLVFYEGTIIGSNIEIMWYGEPSMPNVDVSGKHFYRSDSEWGDIIYDEVIAWMPLPKPYREGGEA